MSMVSLRPAAFLLLTSLLSSFPATPASGGSEEADWTGSYRGRVLEERFRHQQALARRAAGLRVEAPRRLLEDQGEIAVIDTSGGVVEDPNLLDLQGSTLRFTPAGDGFAGAVEPLAFNDAARENGVPLGLDDDDSSRVLLPFSFPFFGSSYDEAFVNSDGNITFLEPDVATSDRSLPGSSPVRPELPLTSWISTPAASLLACASTRSPIVWYSPGTECRSSRLPAQAAARSFSLKSVPTATLRSTTSPSTFRPRSWPSPPGSGGLPTPVDLSMGFPATSGGFAELFQLAADLDVLAAGLSFFANHEDAYDFIVLFNNFGLTPGPGAFAFEVNVRNDILGIGDLLADDPVFDLGPEFGSPRRLTSFVNMGSLTAYPSDPADNIPLIGENSTLSVLSHEVGHRWLAYVDFEHPATGVVSDSLLGRQEAHWSFFFNSEASFVEGNRITDFGKAQLRDLRRPAQSRNSVLWINTSWV